MNQDAAFSWSARLSVSRVRSCLFGDFLVIPIEDSFLYVQPVYVQASETRSRS